MPKVNHRKGGGGGKHISSVDDVKARNEGRLSRYDQAREDRTQASKPGGKEDSSEEEEQQEKPKSAGPKMETANPNAVAKNVMKDGVEISRREREEIEKNAARRRYEELHKQGKTEEAMKDLARLEEIKKKRAEAAQKRKDEEEEARIKEEKGREEKPRDAMVNELKDIMGDGGGKKSKKSKKKDKDDDDEGEEKEEAAEGEEKEKKSKKEKKDDSWQIGIAKVKNEDKKDKKKTDGTIEQCRAEEEDFM